MVSVYFKPTNFCNVGCEHCFLSCKVKADQTLMTSKTIEKSALFIKEMFEDLSVTYKNSAPNIIFHGGEPLMAPLKWYEDAFEILDNILPEKTTYAFQSSIIPHKPEFYPLFKKRFKSHIGTSLDWTARTIDGSPEKYRSLFLKRIKEYRAHDISCNPSLVPIKQDLGHEKEIIDWFIENGFNSLQITRFIAWEFEAENMPTNKEHSEFLINILDYILQRLEKKQKVISIKSIHAVIAGILHNISSDTYSGTCQTLSFTIEPNGDIGMCPNRISYEENYGNVENGWKEFRKNKRRRQWIIKQQMFNFCNLCTSCENISWCKGNCPLAPHDDIPKDDDCPGFKIFIDYVRQLMKDKNKLSLLTKYFEDYSYIGNNIKRKRQNSEKQDDIY